MRILIYNTIQKSIELYNLIWPITNWIIWNIIYKIKFKMLTFNNNSGNIYYSQEIEECQKTVVYLSVADAEMIGQI